MARHDARELVGSWMDDAIELPETAREPKAAVAMSLWRIVERDRESALASHRNDLCYPYRLLLS